MLIPERKDGDNGQLASKVQNQRETQDSRKPVVLWLQGFSEIPIHVCACLLPLYGETRVRRFFTKHLRV
jgi:hypothetical protein